MSKYLIIGPFSGRDQFFERAQELGIIEFISKKVPSLEAQPEIQTFIEALHILRGRPTVEEAPSEEFSSANVLARYIVERQHELESLRENARVLEKDISRIEVFGDFSLQTLHEIEQETGRVIQFFFAKQNTEFPAKARPEVIYVGSQYGLDYFMTINKERTTYDGMVEIIIDRSLGELQVELAEVYKNIDEYEIELARLAHYKKTLKNALIEDLNKIHLEKAKEGVQTVLNGDVFAVECWVPNNKIPLLHKMADEYHLFVDQVAQEKEDKAPTYLENKGVARIGEDLISIYDTPSSTDRDPSTWVFFAFALFFSMIVADAGYGILFLGLSLFLMYKFKKKKGLGKRIIKLLFYLSIGCIIWGILSASFLGIEFAPNSNFRKLSLIDWMIKKKAEYLLEKKPNSYKELIQEYPQAEKATTPEALLISVVQKNGKQDTYTIFDAFKGNVFLELVIFIGTIHIMLSFFRYLDKNWAGAGWVIFMAGAYLYFPSILGAISLIHYIFHVPYELGATIGKYIMYSGLGIAIILAFAQKRFGGLGEIMHVVNVFADVMSYLRIYALSLAGMIMASTFDRIALGVPLIVGILIILAGHAVNITLALMGGIIHGLRLNFIEWYHYSFEGGGKPFHPLKLIKKE